MTGEGELDAEKNLQNDNYKTTSNKLNNNDAKNQLDNYNEEKEKIQIKIKNLDNEISLLNSEIEKINIDKLKESLREKINNRLGEKVVVD